MICYAFFCAKVPVPLLLISGITCLRKLDKLRVTARNTVEFLRIIKMPSTQDIVLITGSSGCLGQFIVKLLQERDDNVIEIRLYDKSPYENNLGHTEKKKMTEYIGDIRDKKMLMEAMENVNCVIHAAAVIDLRVISDVQSLKSNNVDGTQTVIDACLEKNVPRLIFASSTDMVCGSEHVFYGTESTTPIPTTFMLGKYAETKCRAEELILKANGQLCADDKTVLRTVSLRSTPFFGEGDKHVFSNFLRYAKKTNGVHYRVKSLDERLQISYVGNVAWAFVKAKDRLALDETIAGEAFFITDDTPIIDIHELIQPYVEAKGLGFSSFTIPYWVAWIFLSLICLGIKLISFFYPLKVDVPSVEMLNYICSTFFFNRSKATLRLDYEPIYTPEEAKERSLPYYKNLTLK